MNLRIRRLALVLGLLYLVLFAQLNRVQFFGAERLQGDVENSRGLLREFGRARGPIVSADGIVLARSVAYDGSVEYRREYPQGALYAHVVGYQSLNVEATGLERVYNDDLAELPLAERLLSFGDLFGDRETAATLRLTIRHDVQSAAQEALASAHLLSQGLHQSRPRATNSNSLSTRTHFRTTGIRSSQLNDWKMTTAYADVADSGSRWRGAGLVRQDDARAGRRRWRGRSRSRRWLGGLRALFTVEPPQDKTRSPPAMQLLVTDRGNC